MALKSPWSVKGVSQEDRDQAKSAARRAGLPVGVWLSRQIRASGSNNEETTAASDADPGENAAPEQPISKEPQRGAPIRGGSDSRFTFGPGQWSTATDAVEGGRVSQAPPQPWPAARPPIMPVPTQSAPPQHVQAPPSVGQMMPAFNQGIPIASHWAMPPMAHPMYMPQAAPQQTLPQGPSKEDAETIQALERKVESLQKRLAASEARATKEVEAIEAHLAQFDGLAREVEVLRMASNEESEPNYSTAPVERAVMRLSERLQRIEEAILPPESGGGFFSRLFRSR
jgi:hypothetical protein